MSASVESLVEPFRSRVRAVVDESGGKVKVLSARRTASEQITLRKANCGKSDYDIYEKPSMECTPPTAKPGESQHERGLAVDFAGDLDLAAQLGAKHDIKQTIASEPWHFEPIEAAATATPDGYKKPPAGTTLGDGGPSVGVGGFKVSIPNPLSPLETAASFAAVLTRRDTWLRVLGVALGLVLLVLGVGMIAADMGALNATGVGIVAGAV